MGVGGNEIVDLWAKEAAESVVYAVEKPLLNESSLAYVSWSIPEAKIRDTAKWIGTHDKKERRYKPREAGGYASSYGARERPWPASTTSSCRAMQRFDPT